MSALEALSGPVWQRLTWTLLHFLWQAAAVAALLAAVQWLFRARQAGTRYALGLAAMAVMAVCPLVTYALLPGIADGRTDRQGPVAVAAAVQPGLGPTPTARPPGPAVGRGEYHAGTSAATTDPSRREPVLPDNGLPSGLSIADRARWAQPYLLLGWIAGVACLSVRLLLSAVGVQWVRRGRRPIPAELSSRVVRLGEQMGLRSVARVFVSQRVREAIVAGFLRPVVLLPACWLTEMTPEVLEAVIAHELAHIRRWDLWVNLFQRVVETLLFYHPAVWWLSRRIRLEREMCCDERAVAATGRRVTYATLLEGMARRRLAPAKPALWTAIGGKRMTLLYRVRNVLGLSPARQGARWWPVGLTLILLLAGVCVLRMDAARSGQAAGVESNELGEPPSPDRAQRPAAGHRIRPLDLLMIKALGTLLDQPIDGVYLVEPGGKVCLGPAYGRASVQGLTLEGAGSTIQRHLRQVLKSPRVQVTAAGRVSGWRSAVLPMAPYRVGPGDLIEIHVTGTSVEHPVNGEYSVEPSGKVPMGPAYGRVSLQGLTLPEAEKAVEEHLKKVLRAPEACVAMAGWKTVRRRAVVLKPPYRIAPGDLVEVQAIGTLLDLPIAGTYLVEPSGKVALGPAYGRVELKGLTLEEADNAVEKHLRKVLANPEVSVSMAGWRTDEQDVDDLRQLADQVALLKVREKSLSAEVEERKREIDEFGRKVIDLEMTRKEIEKADLVLADLSLRIDVLREELGKGPAEEQSKRKVRFEELRQAYTTAMEEDRLKRSKLMALARQLGSADLETLRRAEKSRLEQYAQLRRQQTRLQYAWRQAQTELEVRRTSPQDTQENTTSPPPVIGVGVDSDAGLVGEMVVDRAPESFPRVGGLVQRQYRTIGRLLVEQVLLLRHWEELETAKGFRIVITELSNNLSKQEHTSRFIVPDSTEKKSQPEDDFEKQLLRRFSKTGPDEAGAAEFAQRKLTDGGQYQYYQAIRAEKSCLTVCHRPLRAGLDPPPDPPPAGLDLGAGGVDPAPADGGRTLKVGDLMAIVRVTVPAGPGRGE